MNSLEAWDLTSSDSKCCIVAVVHVNPPQYCHSVFNTLLNTSVIYFHHFFLNKDVFTMMIAWKNVAMSYERILQHLFLQFLQKKSNSIKNYTFILIVQPICIFCGLSAWILLWKVIVLWNYWNYYEIVKSKYFVAWCNTIINKSMLKFVWY